MSDSQAQPDTTDVAPFMQQVAPQPPQVAEGAKAVEGQKSVLEDQQHSIQARATEETGWGVGGIMLYMARAGQLISPWWSRQRDKDLDKFWKGSDNLSSTIGMLASKVASVPVRVEPRDASMASHRRQAADYTVRLLEESEYGAGWLDECTKFVLDYWCLAGRSRIHLGGQRFGETRTIASMARERDPGPVLSIDDNGCVCERRVVDWHKTPLGDRQWWWLSLKRASAHSGPRRGGLFLTEDHPVLTNTGWLPASQVTPGMMVATGDFAPNTRQAELLTGALLGDGSMTALKNRALLRFGHAESQEPWLDLKLSALEGFRWTGRNKRHAQLGSVSVNVNSRASVALNVWHAAWYPEGKKVVNRECVSRYFSPLMLAVWYCDDGSMAHNRTKKGVPTRPSSVLYTNSFSSEDVHWLADSLAEYGIDCHVRENRRARQSRAYPVIYISTDGLETLAQLIGPYVPPSMRYKLPAGAPPFNPALWDIGVAKVAYDEVAVCEQRDYCQGYSKKPVQDTYHIGVEGVGSFVAGNVAVHNTCDNGSFMEVIGGGSPDGPIVGPALGLAHLDSHRCQRTGEVSYPVRYLDTDGGMYRLHRTRVAFTSDLPSPRAEMYSVGFSALSRSANVAQHLIDIGVYKQEKLGSRPFRGALFAPGIDYDVVQNAFKLAMEGADNAGLSRFNWLPIIAETEPDARLEMVSFSSLPDGFNEEISVRLGMFTIALAFGVPIRWIWPTATTGATKGDAMYQHVAGLGGGIGKLLGSLTVLLGGSPRGPRHMRGKFLPPHLKMTFDFQDDEQDRMRAEIREKRAATRTKELESQVIDLRVAREQALSAGDITDANFAHLELESGRLPDGSSVTTLFSSTDDFYLELLDLGVEEPLAVDVNDPIDMLMEIETAALNTQDIAANASVQSHRHKAAEALAALAALKDLYMPLVDQQIQADMEAAAMLGGQGAAPQAEGEGQEPTVAQEAEPEGPAEPEPAAGETALGAAAQPEEEEGLPEEVKLFVEASRQAPWYRQQVDEILEDIKQFRWGARVGEVIRGQLARGAGGRFVSLDALQSAAMRDLLERLRARRGENGGRGGAAAAKRAANRAKVGKELGRVAEIGALGGLRAGDDIGEDATAALIGQRLAQQNPDGSVTMTSAGRKLLGAANSGNFDSARQALVDAAKAPKDKAGRKPKKDKPAPGSREYERQRLARNRKRVAKEVGDEVDLDALHMLAEGGQPDAAALRELARRGMVVFDKDGKPHMTSLGRDLAEASNNGRTRDAMKVLQRGRDVVKRVQAEGKWRREQADKLSAEVRALESDLAGKEAELAELARDPAKAEEYEELKAEVEKLRAQLEETKGAAQRAYDEADRMEAAFGGVAPSAAEDTKGGPGSGHRGHEGRPGQVGGSMPGAGVGDGAGGAPADVSSTLMDKHMKQGEWVHGAGVADNARKKAVDALAARANVDSDKAAAFIESWSIDSNETPDSALAQQQASDLLNVPLSQYQQEAIGRVRGKASLSADEAQRLLRAMQAETQEQFARIGIEPGSRVTLYRGTNHKPDWVEPGSSGPIAGNVLESWTLRRGIAANSYPWLISMNVLVSSIFSTARTGFGDLALFEVVAIGRGRRTASLEKGNG